MNTRYMVSAMVFDDYEKAVAEAERRANEIAKTASASTVEIRIQVWALAGEVVVERPAPTTRFEKAD